MKPALQVRSLQHLALERSCSSRSGCCSCRRWNCTRKWADARPESLPGGRRRSAAEPLRRAARAPGGRPPRRQRRRLPADAPTPVKRRRRDPREEFRHADGEDWENGTERDDFDGIPRDTFGSRCRRQRRRRRAEARPPRRQRSLQTTCGRRSSACAGRRRPRGAGDSCSSRSTGDGYLPTRWRRSRAGLADMLRHAAGAMREELQERLRCALRWLPEPGAHRRRRAHAGRVLPAAAACTFRRRGAANWRMRICGQHLELLARRDMKKLTALTGADEDLCGRPRR